jgi:hypothetical protein
MNWASLQRQACANIDHHKQQRQAVLITPGEEWYANPLSSSSIDIHLSWQAATAHDMLTAEKDKDALESGPAAAVSEQPHNICNPAAAKCMPLAHTCAAVCVLI